MFKHQSAAAADDSQMIDGGLSMTNKLKSSEDVTVSRCWHLSVGR